MKSKFRKTLVVLLVVMTFAGLFALGSGASPLYLSDDYAGMFQLQHTDELLMLGDDENEWSIWVANKHDTPGTANWYTVQYEIARNSGSPPGPGGTLVEEDFQFEEEDWYWTSDLGYGAGLSKGDQVATGAMADGPLYYFDIARVNDADMGGWPWFDMVSWPYACTDPDFDNGEYYYAIPYPDDQDYDCVAARVNITCPGVGSYNNWKTWNGHSYTSYALFGNPVDGYIYLQHQSTNNRVKLWSDGPVDCVITEYVAYWADFHPVDFYQGCYQWSLPTTRPTLTPGP